MDRTNRVLLALTGLIAVGLGTAGLLAAAEVFGATFSHRRLADNSLWRYFSGHGQWLWAVAAAFAFVVLLLALVWLVRLLFAASERVADVLIRPGDETGGLPGGNTTVQANAVAAAVGREIQGYHGVVAARARVTGSRSEPRLVLEATLSRRADVPALIRRLTDEAIANARNALARPDLAVKLDVAVTDRVVAITDPATTPTS